MRGRVLARQGAGLAWNFTTGILSYALLFAVCAGLLVLPPLMGLLDLLGRYGGDVIVGNYTILPWMLSGRGLLWTVLLLSSSIFLIVLFFAGLFFLFAMRGGRGTLRRFFLVELRTRLPEILWISLRWSGVTLAAVLLLALAPGLAALVFLREHDINYYLKSRPSEWWSMISISALWVGAIGFLLLRGLMRISLFFPLWVRGHGDLRASAYKSWALTRGYEFRLWCVLAAQLGAVLLVHVLLNVLLFEMVKIVLPMVTGLEYGARAVIAGGLFLLILELFVVLCGGVAWLCGTWTVLCERLCPDASPSAGMPTGGGGGSRTLRWLVVLIACGIAVGIALNVVLTLPKKPSQTKTLVIAHRGGAGEAPENSREAVRLAVFRKAADMIEVDVAMTADGVVVLAHDSDLMRQAGDPRQVAEVTWTELRQLTLKAPQSKGLKEARAVRLEDVLKVIGRTRPLILEYKHSRATPELVSKTLALVKKYRLLSRVVFMSLDIEDLREVQELEPDARVGYFVSVEMGNFLKLDLDYIAPRHTLVSRKIVAQLREKKIPVFAWTVDDPVRIIELLGMGVDGIITNEPSKVRKVVNAYFAVPAELRPLLRFRRLWDVLLEEKKFKPLRKAAGADVLGE